VTARVGSEARSLDGKLACGRVVGGRGLGASGGGDEGLRGGVIWR
jgi:hypothetical protein